MRSGCTDSSFHSEILLPASQDASECQDAVTTRQDQSWTCQDVPAKEKPSLFVLRAGLKCRARGCERFCVREVRPGLRSPSPSD
jgi:hypothetical protein